MVRWFPDRQIMVRQGDRISGFRVSTTVQASLATLVLGGTVWALVTTALLIWNGRQLETALADVDAGRSAYQDLAEEVSGQQARMQTITRDLEGYRGMLVSVLDENARLQDHLRNVNETLESTESERATTEQREQRLRDQLQAMERQLGQMSERQDTIIFDLGATRSRLITAESERQRTVALRQSLERRQNQLESELAAAVQRGRELERQLAQSNDQSEALRTLQRRVSAEKQTLERRVQQLEADATTATQRTRDLERQLVQATGQAEGAQAARRQVQAERDQLAERLADATRRADQLAQQHQRELTRLTEQTRGAIQDVERIVGATGLDLNRLLPGQRQRQQPPAPAAGTTGGRGGPFVPWASRSDGETPPTAQNLLSEIERLERMRQLMRSLPVALPLEGRYSVQSNFGYRIDPFNGRPAFHEGIDLQAARGSRVVATAAGVVTVADWNGAYGRMVEVDHGLGFRTRYAHLDSIAVKVGDRVLVRQAVGTLGNTGRSTGHHLHYEVLYQGRNHNPANFLRVISDVSQNRR
ncbi:MAG: hypothetical protein EAZ99_01420 [Alphaproteobacteria bacterium]|nr:MAG: hypothetical protein EAZ99_01420 [Alphaproteobacteria bacterium]